MKLILFYQIEGDIVVKTQQNGKLVKYNINEENVFTAVQNSHSPIDPKVLLDS